jgi:hypothetical protein
MVVSCLTGTEDDSQEIKSSKFVPGVIGQCARSVILRAVFSPTSIHASQTNHSLYLITYVHY